MVNMRTEYLLARRHPVLVLANYCQFDPSMKVEFKRVQSRMLLWCLTGQGRVTANGHSYDFRPDDFLLLPWNHAIAYHTDRQHPFLLGGVHVIPDLAPDTPIVFEVAHVPNSELFDVPSRRDAPVQGCEGVLRGTLAVTPGLSHLADYCVAWFQQGPHGEAEARMLGTLMLAEMERVAATLGAEALPEQFQAMLAELRACLADPFSLTALSTQAHCSVATLNRQFQRHLGLSPLQWLTRERLAKAARLLMTTRLPIGAIGQEVGITDPYYFTKCFTKRYGLSPTAYRRQMSMLMR